jgi:peptidoglycan/xylan/chitin deacetylase (PgdA/CDA1 family)
MPRVIRQSPLRTLVYHRLEEPTAQRADLSPDLVSASVAVFQRQVQHLVRFYDPIGADEVLAALAREHVLPRRAVLVTFDDGYRDFLELAWPVLKREHVPAVLFVPTAFVDNPERIFWWDALWQLLTRTSRDRVALPGAGTTIQLDHADHLALVRRISSCLKELTPVGRMHALDQLQAELGVRPEATHAVLTWSELQGLVADGLTVASHSRTHELLDQLEPASLIHELDGSREDLVRELGGCRPLFAYPNGSFNAIAVDGLRTAGYQAAFTTLHGLNLVGRTSPLLMRRDSGGVQFGKFVVQLLGPVARLRARRHQAVAAVTVSRPGVVGAPDFWPPA